MFWSKEQSGTITPDNTPEHALRQVNQFTDGFCSHGRRFFVTRQQTTWVEPLRFVDFFDRSKIALLGRSSKPETFM